MPKPKTKETLVQGKTKWSQLTSLDTKFQPPSWHITIYPTPDSLALIRDLQGEGLKNVIKKDEENQYFVRFTRYPWKEYKDRTGRMQRIDFAAPEVILRDGRPYREPLGQGSDVTVRLEVYEHNTPGGKSKAKAARLTGVIVDNLVPFSRTDFTPEQEHQVRGLEDSPPVPMNW